jgi:superfamily II DNA or RNA helicase
MDRQDEELNALRRKVTYLERENQILKEMMQEFGLDYQASLQKKCGAEPEQFDPNQGARIHELQITDNTPAYFYKRFWGRQDVYELRYTNAKTGKVGYYTQCYNFWHDGCHKLKKDGIQCKHCEYQAYKPLNKNVVLAHLKGKDPNANDVVAVYPMLPGNFCRFLVFDFDNHEKGSEQDDYANHDDQWKEEVNAMREICRVVGIDALTERSRSGRGAHIWIFFNKAIPAKTARQFGFALLDKGAESINLKSFRYFDRMIPSQDAVPENGFGNVIALPLQGQALKKGNSAFIDENWNAYPDQLQVLWNTESLSPEFIEHCIEEWTGTNPSCKDAEGNSTRTAPWESGAVFTPSDVKGKANIILSNRTYIDTANLQPRIQNQIRRLAAFSNPEFYKNQAIGISNYDESRYIYLGCDDNGYIGIPRGLTDTLKEKFDKAKISYNLDDKRCEGKSIEVSFKGELRDSQQKAVTEMLRHDTGILSAATAFGKTVVCCDLIAERKVNTLILLESSSLIEQWQKAIENFLTINEIAPEYQTKSGRIRRRKSVVGLLQNQHDSLTGIIDIAMVGSVCRKGKFHPKLYEYGQIIVDECHHAASETIQRILMEAKAHYVCGVTATPMRGDGKEKINYFLLGPIRYKYTAKDRAKEQGIDHLVYPRFTRTVAPHLANSNMHPNEAYELIRNNTVRDEQIAADVRLCIENGRTPVILTKYKDHARRLSGIVDKFADHVVLMLGGNSKKEQAKVQNELSQINPKESLILVATGQLIGEGFDYPRLDTLIMATPVAGRSIVEQYAGRLNRDYPGKKNVIVYDYVDSHIPMFDRMYAKRMKAYRQIGYDICTDIRGEKQKANAIFNIDTYGSVFWQDLREASSEIVISSPYLSAPKVDRLIDTMKSRQEAGVKITIVTWNPDSYKYGKSEARMALMSQLHDAGFNIELVEQCYERYAVIDNNIVWYGSVNLLSKEDIEDNIMRVESKEIAAELLETTFGQNIEMEKW